MCVVCTHVSMYSSPAVDAAAGRGGWGGNPHGGYIASPEAIFIDTNQKKVQQNKGAKWTQQISPPSWRAGLCRKQNHKADEADEAGGAHEAEGADEVPGAAGAHGADEADGGDGADEADEAIGVDGAAGAAKSDEAA